MWLISSSLIFHFSSWGDLQTNIGEFWKSKFRTVSWELESRSGLSFCLKPYSCLFSAVLPMTLPAALLMPFVWSFAHARPGLAYIACWIPVCLSALIPRSVTREAALNHWWEVAARLCQHKSTTLKSLSNPSLEHLVKFSKFNPLFIFPCDISS